MYHLSFILVSSNLVDLQKVQLEVDWTQTCSECHEQYHHKHRDYAELVKWYLLFPYKIKLTSFPMPCRNWVNCIIDQKKTHSLKCNHQKYEAAMQIYMWIKTFYADVYSQKQMHMNILNTHIHTNKYKNSSWWSTYPTHSITELLVSNNVTHNNESIVLCCISFLIGDKTF